MQTEVPTLPVVCLDGRKRFTREQDSDSRISPVAVKNHSTCKSVAYLISSRKQLHPLLGGPYRNTVRLYSLSEPAKSTSKSAIGQRVMSAKMLHVKQLQNQLTDAHYHLNELANENRLLKALQKRQDSALKRYEGTNAELPRIINSHHEELRILQTKYKRLKVQHKNTSDVLKEKENELHSLQAQNKHLLQLSKDRNLGERERLQIQVSDLNHRIQQQQETIQTLNRKLTLESKSLKHQLNTEVTRHKETQKLLQETTEKLKSLEDLLDNRERRLYYSGQLPIFNKGKSMGSQSLINLGDRSVTSNFVKPPSKSKMAQNEIQNEILPILMESEPNNSSTFDKTNTSSNADLLPATSKTETMTNLQQVRKFRLQKFPHDRDTSSADKVKERTEKSASEQSSIIKDAADPERLENISEVIDQYNLIDYEREVRRLEQSLEKKKDKDVYKLPKQLWKEFGYSSTESEDEDENDRNMRDKYSTMDPSSKSKELHSRLVNGLPADNADVEVTKYKKKKALRSFTEEELERFVMQKLTLKQEPIIKDSTETFFTTAEHKAELMESKTAVSISESDSESDIELNRREDCEKYKFLLERASNDSGGEDPNDPMDNFFKFDINAADSDTEADKSGKRSDNVKSEGLKDSEIFQSSNRVVTKSVENEYDNNEQHLMNITKSWNELQEKIMKEREASERQLKAMENDLKDHYLKEKEINESELQFDKNDIGGFLPNRKSVSSLSNVKDNLDENLFVIDNQNKRDKSHRNSFAEESSNYVAEMQVSRTEQSEIKSKRLNDIQLDSKESVIELIKREDEKKIIDTNDLFMKSLVEDNRLLTNMEVELNQIDSTREKLKNLAMKNEKQLTHGYKDNAELKDKLNGSLKPENLQKFLDNIQYVPVVSEEDKLFDKEITYKEEMSKEAKLISYNKDKLLAAMKAIDDNENIEFLDHPKSHKSSANIRSQITENLYRGLPTHSKKKDDLMKEIFGDDKPENKVRNGCSKLH